MFHRKDLPRKVIPSPSARRISVKHKVEILKVMEGNLVLECNNCTHLPSEVRTQFTNDHDSEVVPKDLDS